MTTIAPTPSVAEADEVRTELALLQDGIARLRAELDQARSHAASHAKLLADAVALRFSLEDRLAGLEAELARERATSQIRAKLLAEVIDAGMLGRRKAIARAARVERLLSA
jgi:uncharacterized small protein (DUF1192 family)